MIIIQLNSSSYSVKAGIFDENKTKGPLTTMIEPSMFDIIIGIIISFIIRRYDKVSL